MRHPLRAESRVHILRGGGRGALSAGKDGIIIFFARYSTVIQLSTRAMKPLGLLLRLACGETRTYYVRNFEAKEVA